MSTSNEYSVNFMIGLSILQMYRNTEFSISIIENSSIYICGLSKLGSQSIKELTALGWNVGKDKDGGGWAEYHKLEYVDI